MTTTAPAYDETTLREWSAALEGKEPEDILRWAYKTFGAGLSHACSFGGPSGMVILDMLMEIGASNVEVFYLDTDFLFPETYHLRDVCEARYKFKPVGYRSLIAVDEQAAKYGEALWLRDPDACCAIRKVEPNHRALEGKAAWLSGIRRDQSDTRKDVQIVEWDKKFGLVKIAPLAAWSEKQVWSYIMAHDVPYNELHDHHYPSIGCTNCTKPVNDGDDPRSGRWAGLDKTECGIHTEDEIDLTVVEAGQSTSS